MSTPKEVTDNVTIKSLLSKDEIVKRFEDMLGKKAPGFISSILSLSQNSLISKCDPMSVITCAATAATLDLPINQNLGYAWIVPYKGKAQFQIGWKGFVQLALRTGQYQRINVTEVYPNQFNSYNPMTEEIDADFSIVGEGKPVGYVAYFRLNNGFEKISFWTLDKVQKHATKYSQTYNRKSQKGIMMFSPWNDEDQFDSMCMKTVLKNTLAKWGIMSIEMQTAYSADQSVRTDLDGEYGYPDNPNRRMTTIDISRNSEEVAMKRTIQFIEGAKEVPQLLVIEKDLEENDKLTPELMEMIAEKKGIIIDGQSELEFANQKEES